jgi:hypothetical protein
VDYSNPIYFRPSAADTEVLELLAKKHPLSRGSPTDLLRRALESYWFEHAPGIGRSKSERIDQIEKKVDLILAHLGIEVLEGKNHVP